MAVTGPADDSVLWQFGLTPATGSSGLGWPHSCACWWSWWSGTWLTCQLAGCRRGDRGTGPTSSPPPSRPARICLPWWQAQGPQKRECQQPPTSKHAPSFGLRHSAHTLPATTGHADSRTSRREVDSPLDERGRICGHLRNLPQPWSFSEMLKTSHGDSESLCRWPDLPKG